MLGRTTPPHPPPLRLPPCSPPPRPFSIAFKSPGFKLPVPLPGPLATFPRQRCHLPLRGRVPWCCWVGRFACGRGTPSRFIRRLLSPLPFVPNAQRRKTSESVRKMASVQVRAGLPLLALVPHSPLPPPCLPPPPPPPLPIPIVLRVRGVTHRVGKQGGACCRRLLKHWAPPTLAPQARWWCAVVSVAPLLSPRWWWMLAITKGWAPAGGWVVLARRA